SPPARPPVAPRPPPAGGGWPPAFFLPLLGQRPARAPALPAPRFRHSRRTPPVAMPASFLPLITFLAVTFAIIGAWSLAMDLFLCDRSKLKSRLEEELHNRTRVRARQSLLKNLNQNELSALVSEGDERLTLIERVQEVLEQAGLLITPRQLGSYCLVSGCGFGLFTLLIRGHIGIAVAASACGAWLPWMWVKRTRLKRQAAMRLQLADAFELMSSTLQAGQSMAQAMQAVAADFPAPIA
ncbi:MAG: type II secretion system F family protein, partial [Planctomycetaceae bacterium]